MAEAQAWKAAVGGLARLTPGEVAAVVRQYALWEETPSAGAFYDRLRAELAAKRGEAALEPPTPAPRQRMSTEVYG